MNGSEGTVPFAAQSRDKLVQSPLPSGEHLQTVRAACERGVSSRSRRTAMRCLTKLERSRTRADPPVGALAEPNRSGGAHGRRERQREWRRALGWGSGRGAVARRWTWAEEVVDAATDARALRLSVGSLALGEQLGSKTSMIMGSLAAGDESPRDEIARRELPLERAGARREPMELMVLRSRPVLLSEDPCVARHPLRPRGRA